MLNIKQVLKMLIKGLQKTTLIDYPDEVACTVFLFGCNFRCPFCYNISLVDKSLKDENKTISEEELFNFLRNRRKLLDAVCITGGEPLMNKDLPELLSSIKQLGYKIKIDTNGSKPKMLKLLIENKLVDYIAMDIKSSEAGYNEASGVIVDIDAIKHSIDIIINSQLDYEFRTTIVPGLHVKDDILKIAQMIKGAKLYVIQQFKPEKTLGNIQKKPFIHEQLQQFAEECSKFVKTEVR
jgi:pyruvate formate lyase activating enzyme